MDQRNRHLTAAAALVASAPVATWCLLPDLSASGFADHQLDYMTRLRPPEVPWPVEVLAGVVALTLFVVGAAEVADAVHRGRLDHNWLGTIVPLTAAGILLAGGGRAVTAGTIGANIGGGMFLLLGLPFAAALLVAAAVNTWVQLRD